MTSPADQDALDEVRRAVTHNDGALRIETVHTFGQGGLALQLSLKENAWDTRGRFKKVGPLLFPAEGQSTADVLRTLASLMEGA